MTLIRVPPGPVGEPAGLLFTKNNQYPVAHFNLESSTDNYSVNYNARHWNPQPREGGTLELSLVQSLDSDEWAVIQNRMQNQNRMQKLWLWDFSGMVVKFKGRERSLRVDNYYDKYELVIDVSEFNLLDDPPRHLLHKHIFL